MKNHAGTLRNEVIKLFPVWLSVVILRVGPPISPLSSQLGGVGSVVSSPRAVWDEAPKFLTFLYIFLLNPIVKSVKIYEMLLKRHYALKS